MIAAFVMVVTPSRVVVVSDSSVPDDAPSAGYAQAKAR
jgi:hypothetical protein